MLILYSYNSDKLKAERKNTSCKKCMSNSGKFVKGNTRGNHKSPKTMWIERYGEEIGDKMWRDHVSKQRGSGSKDTYVKYMGRHEHRVVMEIKLGRKLLSHEIVHHKDHNKKNNHPDNLELTNRRDHGRYHSTKNRKCSVDGCARKHLSLGLCQKHYYHYKIKPKNT